MDRVRRRAPLTFAARRLGINTHSQAQLDLRMPAPTLPSIYNLTRKSTVFMAYLEVFLLVRESLDAPELFEFLHCLWSGRLCSSEH